MFICSHPFSSHFQGEKRSIKVVDRHLPQCRFGKTGGVDPRIAQFRSRRFK
jgi:hypothetical protein